MKNELKDLIQEVKKVWKRYDLESQDKAYRLADDYFTDNDGDWFDDYVRNQSDDYIGYDDLLADFLRRLKQYEDPNDEGLEDRVIHDEWLDTTGGVRLGDALDRLESYSDERLAKYSDGEHGKYRLICDVRQGYMHAKVITQADMVNIIQNTQHEIDTATRDIELNGTTIHTKQVPTPRHPRADLTRF